MGLIHHDVTLLDFDEIYSLQPRLSRAADERICLRDIKEANLFCTRETLEEIRRRLAARSGRGITYIGNGNYHYVTFLLLREIKEPFSLVLFDNHTDAKVPCAMPELVSCGSWISEAARLPHLQRVIMVGVHSPCPGFPPDLAKKIVLWPETDRCPNSFSPSDLLSVIGTDNVYISIDKDVLSPLFATTNWDQGTMRLDTLMEILQTIVRKKNVLGVDICGEWVPAPSDLWRCSPLILLNERANLAILESVRCS